MKNNNIQLVERIVTKMACENYIFFPKHESKGSENSSYLYSRWQCWSGSQLCRQVEKARVKTGLDVAAVKIVRDPRVAAIVHLRTQ